MPVGKSKNNAIFYALVTFVALFIVSTTVAVIFYIKSEDFRDRAATLRQQMDELATTRELNNLGSLVGTRQRDKTRLAALLDYVNQAVSLIIGAPVEDTSAEEKLNLAKIKFNNIWQKASEDISKVASADVNSTGLVQISQILHGRLESTQATKSALAEQLEKLEKRFDDAMEASREKEQKLLAEKEKYQQQFQQIKNDYEQAKQLIEQSSEQRLKTLMQRLEQKQAQAKQLQQDLLKTQAELKMTSERMEQYQDRLAKLVPPPDEEVEAFQPDGKIMLVDQQSQIVHINLGTADHVHRGLTFSVYEKNMPIPRSGKGKAQIKVFDVQPQVSVARIMQSDPKNPIIRNDIVANLVWDSDEKNAFVVTGDFDLDGDGIVDYKGDEKIKGLIERWGGKVEQSTSVDTDFVVLGTKPELLPRPTYEKLEIDPMAMEKYEQSLEKADHYQQILKQIETFSIPAFNTERFLYFIGYMNESQRPGAF